LEGQIKLGEDRRVEIENAQPVNTGRSGLPALVLFFAVVGCTYIPWRIHHYRLFLLDDSGLFLHVGQRLIQGDLLYREISDNKPPLIYWLNALGLLLGRGSPGGVLLLCVTAQLLTLAILYRGLRQHIGWPLFIAVGSLVQLAYLSCAGTPNFTETFSLPLIALSAALFSRELLDERGLMRCWVAQGAIAALLLCLRPNNAGISVICFLYILFGSPAAVRLRKLLWFTGAAVIVYFLTIVPLAIQGLVRDYISAAIGFAGSYAGGNHMADRLKSVATGIDLFGASPLLYLGLCCSAAVLLSAGDHRRKRVARWLTAWLILEVGFSSVSGYRWPHYYLLWILPMVFLMAICGGFVVVARAVNPRLPILLAISLGLLLLHRAAVDTYKEWITPRSGDPALALARAYLREGDRLTTWGYFAHNLWFELNHRPGTRVFHEVQYMNRGMYRELVPTFLSDLEQNRPRVVIERRSVVPLFAPADDRTPLNTLFPPNYFSGWDGAEIKKRKAALSRLYAPVVERSGIILYLRRD
jgi:hypothetical protein